MKSQKAKNKKQKYSNGDTKKENPIIIEQDDDCIELDKTKFKVSVLKQRLLQKQKKYAENKIIFGFKFEFEKVVCCFCKKEGHINCSNINYLIDNIYKQ